MNTLRRGPLLLLLLLTSLFLTPFFLTPLAGKEIVYVLIARDTAPDIALDTESDKNRILQIVRLIPKNRAKKIIRLLTGSKISSRQLASWIRSIPTQKNARILFYYSGHGGRRQDTRTPWPILMPKKQLISTDEIHSHLKKRAPKLLISVTDSCNADIDGGVFSDSYFIPFAIYRPTLISKKSISNVESLFLKSSGFFAITAAQPGKLAMSSEAGSLLTCGLYSTILGYNKKAPLTWHRVAQRLHNHGTALDQPPHAEVQIRQKIAP